MQVTQSSNSSVYATTATQKSSRVSAYDATSTQSARQTDKLAQMEEKYKDIYTPIPETYAQEDEDLQAQKIYEAYPNYVSGQDFLKIVDKYYAQSGAEPFKLGTTLTEQQIKAQEEASAKAFEEIGQTEKSFSQMQKDVQQIKQEYPYNDISKKGATYGTEIARFINAAVYEGLEEGKSVEEAKIYAKNLSQQYMSYEGYQTDNILKSMSETPLTTPDSLRQEVSLEADFNSPINTIWDFKKYGIDGDWTKNDVYTNSTAMIAELQQKLNDFSFLLNNDTIVQEANSKLNTNDQNLAQSTYYKELINNEYMPNTEFALNIFQNYNIYNSIDTKA